MRPRRTSRWSFADAVVLTAVGALIATVVALSPSSATPRDATVRWHALGRLVPPGFLGLSLEYSGLEPYAGRNASALNPVFVQLVRNIAGPEPGLRIGGDSTDWTWWPVAHAPRPPGVTYSLTPQWLAVARRLTDRLHARLTLGINLEADLPALATAEASALLGALGPGSVNALELGNEPELYGAFPWYRTAGGRPVRGRSSRYDFAAFERDFTRFAAAVPYLPLAGPAAGGRGYLGHLGGFIANEPRLRILTLHRYPLQLCFADRHSAEYPTVAHLLADTASRGLAQSFAPYAALAHRRGLVLRLDELNTVSCGADPPVSQSFASALWALDALFSMVRAGIDGVNIHTFPGAGYELFRFTQAGRRWRASVSPEYYGLLMFAEAVPPGSRLVPISAAPSRGPLHVWGTRALDGRVRVVAINDDPGRTRTVALRIPGAVGAASLERLQAPSASARTGVTLGGWSFGASTSTGVPGNRAAPVRARRGVFVVGLPRSSAALLTVAAR
jgi:glycosyl hydrolase family 79